MCVARFGEEKAVCTVSEKKKSAVVVVGMSKNTAEPHNTN